MYWTLLLLNTENILFYTLFYPKKGPENKGVKKFCHSLSLCLLSHMFSHSDYLWQVNTVHTHTVYQSVNEISVEAPTSANCDPKKVKLEHTHCRGIWEQNGHYSFIDQNSRIIRNNNLFLLLPFSLLKGYFPKANQNGRRTEKDFGLLRLTYPPLPLILSLARQNMILISSQRDRIKPVTYSRLGMETFLVLTWWQRSYFNF